ncbi:MAG: hypothetical protein JO101_05175 [Candidatus Eremiobacteraeota bacterium]|nr:hypothetical protein [Candidatus Eremiobacteraeota bacterium]MBV8354693.1 hypothetical protein [Candidatus Eremiobacteraeota bacterium]
MVTLLNALLFLTALMIVIELAQPATLRTKDLQVWSDDVERRLSSGLGLGPRR